MEMFPRPYARMSVRIDHCFDRAVVNSYSPTLSCQENVVYLRRESSGDQPHYRRCVGPENIPVPEPDVSLYLHPKACALDQRRYGPAK